MNLQSVMQTIRAFPGLRRKAAARAEAGSPLRDDRYDTIVAWLQARSANDIPHVKSTLLPHLIGTYELLRAWENPLALCHAGLCHAVYGTYGFEACLLELTQRDQLRELIGAEAEDLVYVYSSCDRPAVYPQIGFATPVNYRDRFTGNEFTPSDSQLSQLMELTFANELELARADKAFLEYTRDSLGTLFARCGHLVSAPAFAYFNEIYGPPTRTDAAQSL